MKRTILISDIRKNIKELCTNKGISLKKCFIDSNVEEHYLYNCEYLCTLPNITTLINISQYLDCTIDYLLYGDENGRNKIDGRI